MGRHSVTTKYVAIIMKLHEEGLPPATIERRVPYTARTVARVIKRELEKQECQTTRST